jgi:hypothetical protein
MSRFTSCFAAVAVACISMVGLGNADQAYENVDSLRVGRLTYLLALDRYTYGFTDTIHISTRVANRTAEVETLQVDANCTGYSYNEIWCSSVDSICSAPDPFGFCFCVGQPAPWIRLIPPGEIHIADYVIRPAIAPSTNLLLYYAKGVVSMCPPWNPSSFHLEAAYERRSTTAVILRTWGRVKCLFE